MFVGYWDRLCCFVVLLLFLSFFSFRYVMNGEETHMHYIRLHGARNKKVQQRIDMTQLSIHAFVLFLFNIAPEIHRNAHFYELTIFSFGIFVGGKLWEYSLAYCDGLGARWKSFARQWIGERKLHKKAAEAINCLNGTNAHNLMDLNCTF